MHSEFRFKPGDLLIWNGNKQFFSVFPEEEPLLIEITRTYYGWGQKWGRRYKYLYTHGKYDKWPGESAAHEIEKSFRKAKVIDML